MITRTDLASSEMASEHVINAVECVMSRADGAQHRGCVGPTRW